MRTWTAGTRMVNNQSSTTQHAHQYEHDRQLEVSDSEMTPRFRENPASASASSVGLLGALSAAPCRFECSRLLVLYASCVDQRLTRSVHFTAGNSCRCSAIHYSRCTIATARLPPPPPPPPASATDRHLDSFSGGPKPLKPPAPISTDAASQSEIDWRVASCGGRTDQLNANASASAGSSSITDAELVPFATDRLRVHLLDNEPSKLEIAPIYSTIIKTPRVVSDDSDSCDSDVNRNTLANGVTEGAAASGNGPAAQSGKPSLVSGLSQSPPSGDASLSLPQSTAKLTISVADQLLKNRSSPGSNSSSSTSSNTTLVSAVPPTDDATRHDDVTVTPDKSVAGNAVRAANDAPKVLAKQTSASSLNSAGNATAASPSNNQTSSKSVIPRFHFPNGVPPPTNTVSNELKLVVEAFAKFDGRVRKHELGEFLRACRVPMYWKQAVWSYVQAMQADTVKHGYLLKDTFIPLWSSVVKSCHDDASRFVRVITCASREYLVFEDLVPLIQDVVDSHPGLSFLHDAKDFHLRYVQTVIARLFYVANASWTGRLTVSELRRCNFLAMLASLQDEEDVNNVTDFFSYEHFYVIYCKFWELDLDHDLVIDYNDLRRYQNGALSTRVTARIFSGTVIRNQLQKQDKMTYQDFVWFLISEVDKKHPRSIEYWFRVMDLDGDGMLSMYELEYFYEEQVKRMESLGITETLPFQDCLCQVLDMARPANPLFITLTDLKRSRHLCDVFFDTFVNVEKYLENEQRDPFANVRDFAEDSEAANSWNAPGAAWNRYAAGEYEVLVAQENEQQTNAASTQQSFNLADSSSDRLRSDQDDLDDDMLDLSYKLSNQDRFEPSRVQRIDSFTLNKDPAGIVVEKDSNKSKSPTMSTSTSLSTGSQRRKAS